MISSVGARGRLTLTVMMSLGLILGTLLPVAAAQVGATLDLSESVGHPTTRIQATGAGFGAQEAVRVTFDSRQIARARTDGTGGFTKFVRVPAQAQPGDHFITATGRESHRSASVPFTVRTDWPTFHFSPNRTGYNPYENTLSGTNVSGLVPMWIAPLSALTGVSPAVVDGVVYEGDFSNDLFAFDARSGEKLWETDLTGDFLTSPAVVDGAVYVGNSLGSSVIAVDAASGVVLWQRFLGGGVFDAPAVVGGVVYIGSNGGDLYALDAETGAQIWSAPYTGAPDSPAVSGGVVYVGGFDQRLHAFEAATGAELWSVQLEDIIESTPAVVDGVVYVGSSNMPPYEVYAIDAVSGAILWTSGVSGQVQSSPAVANGTVYVNTFDGFVWAFNAATGGLKWTKAVGGCNSSPAVANGVLYVGSDDFSVYALNASSGATLWSWATGDKACSSPVVADGVLYMGSFDTNLYAFGLP